MSLSDISMMFLWHMIHLDRKENRVAELKVCFSFGGRKHSYTMYVLLERF